MRLGLIIPHKTKVAIALWRRNTKEFKALRCVTHRGLFLFPPLIPRSFLFIPPPTSPKHGRMSRFGNFISPISISSIIEDKKIKKSLVFSFFIINFANK